MRKSKRNSITTLFIIMLCILCACSICVKHAQTVSAATKYKLVDLPNGKTKIGKFYLIKSTNKQGVAKLYFQNKKMKKKKKLLSLSTQKDTLCDNVLVYNKKAYFTASVKKYTLLYCVDSNGKLKKLASIKTKYPEKSDWLYMWGMYGSKILLLENYKYNNDNYKLYIYNIKTKKIKKMGTLECLSVDYDTKDSYHKYINPETHRPEKYTGQSTLYFDNTKILNLKTLKTKSMIPGYPYGCIYTQIGNDYYVGVWNDECIDWEEYYVYKYNASTKKKTEITMMLSDETITAITDEYIDYHVEDGYIDEYYRYMIKTKQIIEMEGDQG